MERDLRWQVGQKLAVGFPGTEVPQALRELVAEYKIGNIILFEENIRDAAQPVSYTHLNPRIQRFEGFMVVATGLEPVTPSM